MGVVKQDLDMIGAVDPSDVGEFDRVRGMKRYELANHLGNVLTVISDRKMATVDNGVNVYYHAEIISYSDYYPFGAPMSQGDTDRTWSVEEYRFGFNTQEKVDEVSGAGNHNTAYFGDLDTRLGRRWNLDPKPNEAISYYAVFANNPVWFFDMKLDTPTVKEAALMSKKVYGGLSKKEQAELDQSGWKVSSAEKGLNYDSKSGMHSELYERTIDGKTEYSLVFEGSTSLNDWTHNLLQFWGFSDQTSRAIKLAQDLTSPKSKIHGQELTFVGHSLGGGLANAAALKTNRPSITFNPAWLSSNTIAFHGLNIFNQHKLKNYVILGEILNTTQMTLGLNPLVPKVWNVGKTYYLNSLEAYVPYYGPYTCHGIDQCIEEVNDVPEYNQIKNGK